MELPWDPDSKVLTVLLEQADSGNFTQLSFLTLLWRCWIQQMDLLSKRKERRWAAFLSPCSSPLLSILFSFTVLHSSVCAMRVDLDLSPGHPAPLQCRNIPSEPTPRHLCTDTVRSRRRARVGSFVSQSCYLGFLQTAPLNQGVVICRNWKDKKLKHLKVQRKKTCPIFHLQRYQILIKTSLRRKSIKNLLLNVMFVNFYSAFHTAPNKNNNKLYLLTTENYICSFKLKRGAFWYLPLAFLPVRQRQFEKIILE